MGWHDICILPQAEASDKFTNILATC